MVLEFLGILVGSKIVQKSKAVGGVYDFHGGSRRHQEYLVRSWMLWESLGGFREH